MILSYLQDGTCHLDCAVAGSCGKMGYHADELKSIKSAHGRKYYMKTTSRAPYCGTKTNLTSVRI